MGLTDTDTLKGKITLATSPTSLCWGKPSEFVKKLTEILTVRFPVSRDNQFTVVGHQTPSLDDKGKCGPGLQLVEIGLAGTPLLRDNGDGCMSIILVRLFGWLETQETFPMVSNWWKQECRCLLV